MGNEFNCCKENDNSKCCGCCECQCCEEYCGFCDCCGCFENKNKKKQNLNIVQLAPSTEK